LTTVRDPAYRSDAVSHTSSQPPRSGPPEPTGAAAAPDPSPRVRATVDQWKRGLLDLSKRNRLLNFRVTPVSTVAIAQALGAGRTVLFVAEKMAALEVVHRRLVAAGLGEFCLEVHSTKANKRAVIAQIKEALDASLQRPALADVPTTRLTELRQELTDYVRAVHEPYGALGTSPYRAYGDLGPLLDAPKLPWSGDAALVGREALRQTERDLDDLAAAAAVAGDPRTHPWRDSGKTF
jgi:hypothetical protein